MSESGLEHRPHLPSPTFWIPIPHAANLEIKWPPTSCGLDTDLVISLGLTDKTDTGVEQAYIQ